MISFRTLVKCVAFTVAVTNIPALAAPADTLPTRIANVWDGRSHEPDPSAVAVQERAAGVGLSPQRESAETLEIEASYERLARDEGLATTSARTSGIKTARVFPPQRHPALSGGK